MLIRWHFVSFTGMPNLDLILATLFEKFKKQKYRVKPPSITIGLNGLDSKMFCKLYLSCDAFLNIDN